MYRGMRTREHVPPPRDAKEERQDVRVLAIAALGSSLAQGVQETVALRLTEAQAALRIHKSELAIRPIWHQKAERIKAHFLVCFPG